MTLAPRASQVPGRPARAVPRHAQASPSWLVAYAVVMRSSWPGSSSGWQQTQACQRPSATRMTGSLTPTRSSPANTVAASASASPSGSAASSTSIHQCLLSGVAQQTYSRQRPSGVRTTAGRSIDIAPNRSLSRRATVVSASPSAERATTVAAPRRSTTRTR